MLRELGLTEKIVLMGLLFPITNTVYAVMSSQHSFTESWVKSVPIAIGILIGQLILLKIKK